MKNIGMLFLEYQNDFLHENGTLYPLVQKCLTDAFLKNSSNVLRASRQANVSIVHVPLVSEHTPNNNYGILDTVAQSNAFKINTWGHSFIESMNPKKNEFVIQKKSGISAFQGTNLDVILQKNKINTVYICGLLTHICIESTVRDAYDRGYDISVISDSVLSIDPMAHTNALELTLPLFSKIISSNSLIEELTQTAD